MYLHNIDCSIYTAKDLKFQKEKWESVMQIIDPVGYGNGKQFPCPECW